MFRLSCFLFFLIPIVYISCASQQKKQVNEYIEQGNTYYKDKDYNAAFDSFSKALRLDNTLEIKIKLIDIYFRLENYRKARSMLDTIIQQDQDNEIVQELNAYYYLLIEENQKAIELYTLLLEDTKHQPRVLSNLGVLYARVGDFQASHNYFKQAIQIANIDINVLDSYFHVLLELYKGQNNAVNKETTVVLDLQFVIEKAAEEYKKKNMSLKEVRYIADMLLRSNFPQYSYSLYAFLVQKKVKGFDETELSELNNDTMQDNQDTPQEKDIEKNKDNEDTEVSVGEIDNNKVSSDTHSAQVSETDNDNTENENPELKEVLVILAQMLFNRDYDIIVPQRFLRGLIYLEVALESGYGTTQKEKQILIELLDGAPTDVLSTRIFQIYNRYNISFITTNSTDEEQ